MFPIVVAAIWQVRASRGRLRGLSLAVSGALVNVCLGLIPAGLLFPPVAQAALDRVNTTVLSSEEARSALTFALEEDWSVGFPEHGSVVEGVHVRGDGTILYLMVRLPAEEVGVFEDQLISGRPKNPDQSWKVHRPQVVPRLDRAANTRSPPGWWKPHELPDAETIVFIGEFPKARGGGLREYYFVLSKATGMVYVYRYRL